MHDASLLDRSGRRRALCRELQDGNELLQGEVEDLGNFHKRVAIGNALKDLSQRCVRSANHPDIAALSGRAP